MMLKSNGKTFLHHWLQAILPQRLYTVTFIPALTLVFFLMLAACGSLPANHHHQSSSDEIGNQIVSQATLLLGKPYQFGGNNLRGFDCSGLVQYAHRQTGIRIPRTTRDQLAKIKPVKHSQLKPGDVLFFRIDRGKSLHVAIYSGNNHMIHAPSSGKKVTESALDNNYWQDRLIKIGRFY